MSELLLAAKKLGDVRSSGRSEPARQGIDDLLRLRIREASKWSIHDQVGRHGELHVLGQQRIVGDLGEIKPYRGSRPLPEVVRHDQALGPILVKEFTVRCTPDPRKGLRDGIDCDGLGFGVQGKTPDLETADQADQPSFG